MSDFWIILTSSLVAINCSIVGSFLLVRKKAMMGDAISHAVLPGIVIAYMLVGSRDSIPVLIGAASAGLLVTFLIEFFNKKANLQSDAAMGLSYTFFFAVGIILISYNVGGDVDLDQECVLYGEVAVIGFDKVSFLGMQVPRQTLILASSLIIISTLIGVGYRKLLVSSFDSQFAAAIGVPIVFWEYYLMGSVSLTTVVSFNSVGVVLVIAFLIGPTATAYLLSKRFPSMLILSLIFGISASIIGNYVAQWLNGSVAGAIAMIIGIQFTFAFIFIQFKSKILKGQTISEWT